MIQDIHFKKGLHKNIYFGLMYDKNIRSSDNNSNKKNCSLSNIFMSENLCSNTYKKSWENSLVFTQSDGNKVSLLTTTPLFSKTAEFVRQ
jgi:hypothetical protein